MPRACRIWPCELIHPKPSAYFQFKEQPPNEYLEISGATGKRLMNGGSKAAKRTKRIERRPECLILTI